METTLSTLEEMAANLMALELRAERSQATLFAQDAEGWDELMTLFKSDSYHTLPPELMASSELVTQGSRITVLRLIEGGLS
jgi:hypothetical protein